jgi:HSP20 family protein
MFSLITRRNRKRGLSLFDDPFFDDFFNMPFFYDRRKVMKTDVREDDKNFYLDVELPGIEKKDIKLSLENGYLTVAVEREENNEQMDEKGSYVRRERYYGNCARTFYLGDVREEDITANYNNGILTVSVPKQDVADKKKYIEIE